MKPDECKIGTAGAERMRRLLKVAVAAFSAVVFAVVGGRIAYAAWQMSYSPSMDYGVVVEMARNIASGTDWPVFFYGQAYMGSLEPAASALLCALFGPHPFWVCMGTALFAIATVAVMAMFARRLGGVGAMPLAMLLTTSGGIYWMHFMASPRGGYSLATLLALIAIYLGSVAEFTDAGSGRIRPWRAATAGLVAGLVFWNFWLALPAVVAGAAILLFRLRWKMFSWSFILPAAAAFFIGSAPWWLWMANPNAMALHGGGHIPPLGFSGPREIVTTVLPIFLGFKNKPMWSTPFPWPPLALAAFAAVEAISCPRRRAAGRHGEDGCHGRRRGRRLFLAATALFTLLFVAAYSFSSFGASRVARYFVVLLPPWCVAIASALSESMRKPSLRICAIALMAAYVAFTGLHSVRDTDEFLAKMQREDAGWRDRMRAAVSDPAFAEPAFADFTLFGANWVTDRKLCLTSPLRWRYRPYLEALERAKSPAVVNNFLNFEQFCSATGGSCRRRNVHGLEVCDRIKAPPLLREVPSSAILDMAYRKDEIHADLIDDNIATMAILTGGDNSSVDIVFRDEIEIAGVRAILTYSSAAYGWRAEKVNPDGTLSPLSRLNPHKGWFWSGKRPYAFGPSSFWELRWKPARASRIRVTFEGLRGDAPDGAFTVCLADLRVLSSKIVEGGANPKLPPAMGRKLHAPRHLADRPDPALDYGMLGVSLALPQVCGYCAVDPGKGAVIVMEPDAAAAAMDTLASCGVEAEIARWGLYDVISVPESRKTVPYRLRYYGGRLFKDDPSKEKSMPMRVVGPVVEFGGEWTVSCFTKIPETLHPGDALSLYFGISPDRDISPFRQDLLFVHAVRDGRIVAQGCATVYGAAAGTPADNPQPGLANIHVMIPEDIGPGPLEFMICVKKSSGLLRLRPSVDEDGIGIDRRRVVIGGAAVAAP